MQSKREMFFKGEAQSPSGPPPQPPSLNNNINSSVSFCGQLLLICLRFKRDFVTKNCVNILFLNPFDFLIHLACSVLLEIDYYPFVI